MDAFGRSLTLEFIAQFRADMLIFSAGGVGANGCVDINECRVGTDACDPLAECINTTGSYTCGGCPPGYTGGGATGCMDINECTALARACAEVCFFLGACWRTGRRCRAHWCAASSPTCAGGSSAPSCSPRATTTKATVDTTITASTEAVKQFAVYTLARFAVFGVCLAVAYGLFWLLALARGGALETVVDGVTGITTVNTGTLVLSKTNGENAIGGNLTIAGVNIPPVGDGTVVYTRAWGGPTPSRGDTLELVLRAGKGLVPGSQPVDVALRRLGGGLIPDGTVVLAAGSVLVMGLAVYPQLARLGPAVRETVASRTDTNRALRLSLRALPARFTTLSRRK